MDLMEGVVLARVRVLERDGECLSKELMGRGSSVQDTGKRSGAENHVVAIVELQMLKNSVGT